MLYVYHMERLEAIVSGRVQGVMYRDFAKRAAERLLLVGEVENLSDGSVRVVAEGERSILEAFVTELEKGSFHADVKKVSPAYVAATGAFSSFDIVSGKR